ncbi:MAG TPA: GNAT family N-acetyltransferase [Acidimicrobiales bacterium]|nr:GNAT family N-acetyltransferase [Acidimicrobiales bacterium]
MLFPPMRVSRSSIRIEALRETVWATVWAIVTEPAYVKQWQYGSDLQTDWSVGSPIRFTSQWEGQVFEQWRTVVDVGAPSRLTYSLFAPGRGLEDKPENYFTMTYILDEDRGVITLTIVKEDPRPGAEGTHDGDDGNPVLTMLKSLAESVVSRRLVAADQAFDVRPGFLRSTAEHGEQRPFGYYRIDSRTDGQAVGGIGFKGPPQGGAVEIGYGLVPSARGHGYAAEAVAALLTLAVQQGLTKVLAKTAPNNTASQVTLTRAGFRSTGSEGDLRCYEVSLVAQEARPE